MLRIHASNTNAVKSGYYENGLASEGDYYLDKSLEASWKGNGSKILGIEGKTINRDDFQRLADNINPQTNERLNARHSQDRRVGYDISLSAPKSVSLLWGITKDDNILEAHRSANNLTMKAIEQDAYTQSNTKYERGYTKTSNLIYGSFHQHTSRPTKLKNSKDVLIDMQLHTHNFMMNSTYCFEHERFQALENHHIVKSAPHYEAMYHSFLSHQLNEMGYTTRRTPIRFEVLGISQNLIDRFSSRTMEIENAAKEKGIIDAKAKSELGAKIRLAKDKAVNQKDVFKHWRNRISEHEYAELKSLKGKYKPTDKKITPQIAIDKSLEHHLERNSTSPTKLVLAHAIKLGYGQLKPKEVEDELNSRTEILKSKFDTIEHLTTKIMVQSENKMIEDAASGKGVLPALYKDYKPTQAFLNDDQTRAIKELLSSQDRVTILSGSAGVGKTSLLTEVRDGIREKKKSLFAVAPSTQASKVLKEKQFDSDTIAALLVNPRLEEKVKNQCLLVDEAGMVGVEQMSKIMQMAKRNNTRVYLSGDTLQHGPPGQYGDAMRILQEKANLKTVKVNKIVRQKPEKYRNAIEDMAKGNLLKGFNKLDALGAIKEIPNTDERLQELADDYSHSLKQKRSALIISPTHAEGQQITEIVKRTLRKNGKISGNEKNFNTLQNLSLTNSEKTDALNYQSGQIVRFIRNQKGGYKAGTHHEIVNIDKNGSIEIREMVTGNRSTLPFKNTQNFQVYNRNQTSLAKGDLLRLTNNTKSIEKTKMANGTTYQVRGFSKTGDIRLSNGKTLSKDNFHWRLGYCETSFSSQGKDAMDIFIAQSELSYPASNAQQLYVSASRGTHSISIYSSNKAELKKAVSRSGERMSAYEIAEKQNYKQRLLKQQNHHKSLTEKLRNHGRTLREKQTQRDIYKP